MPVGGGRHVIQCECRADSMFGMQHPGHGKSVLSTTIGMESTKSKDNLTKALSHDQTALGRWADLIRCSDLLYLCQTEVEDFA